MAAVSQQGIGLGLAASANRADWQHTAERRAGQFSRGGKLSTRTPQASDHGFEHVYVEADFWDGVRSGLADVDGSPHYFKALDEYGLNEELDGQFYVWPADQHTLELEQRQWRTFVAWNDRFRVGQATVEQHPGKRGVDPKYDRLEDELEPRRTPPSNSRVVRATWKSLGRDKQYTEDGPGYLVRWD